MWNILINMYVCWYSIYQLGVETFSMQRIKSRSTYKNET